MERSSLSRTNTNLENEMKVLYILKGKVVKTKEEESELFTYPNNGPTVDRTADAFIHDLTKRFEEQGHFVESGCDTDKRGPHSWFILHCGDNCIKVYPEGSVA